MGDYFDNLLLTLIKVLWTVKPYSPKFFTISAIILQIFQNQKSLTNYVNKNELRSEYDYIVIGAGSAGSVMASRLSEDPNKSVLLLEAGMPENILTTIPRSAFILHETPIDWAYLTEPQNNSCWGIRSRRSRFSKGKLMGGSSAINLMAVSRGNPRDYDKWKAQGCDGWSWADLFPYFIKLEDNQDHRMVATGYHGKGGPMAVSTQTFVETISYAFRDAAPYMNMSIGDPLGPTQSVFTIHQRSELNGERMSTSRAYLQSLPELRSNLDIFTKAFVTKIIFDETKRAVGIRAVINGEKKEINVTKEIVLSAGSIQSPQLLMLSGI